MKCIIALMLVAMATFGSGESIQMLELSPAVGPAPVCEVSLWCQDYATAERCDKVSYCRKWIWMETEGEAPDAVTCDTCKEVMGELLMYNATIINDLCGLLGPLADKCKQELHKWIDPLTPQSVCHFIHFCPQSDALRARQLLEAWLSKYETQPDLDWCPVCKSAVDFLLNNTGALESILKDVCGKTPLKDECDIVVDALVKELQTLNATFICTKLDMCSGAPRQLLGADMCTRGPSYWCASLDNAQECQALDFCNEKYWF